MGALIIVLILIFERFKKEMLRDFRANLFFFITTVLGMHRFKPFRTLQLCGA
jgi:hypothetical protein